MVTFLALGSCSNKMINFLSKPVWAKKTPPPGPPEFQAGFTDGCNSGMSENQYNLFASTFQGYYKHPVLNNRSLLYRRTWQDAFTYCYLWMKSMAIGRPASFFRVSWSLQNKAMPGSIRKNLLSDAPPGPEEYRRGWVDGCNSGKGANGKTKHKFVYRFFKDARYIEGDRFNPKYNAGWKTAFWYCHRYYDLMESGRRNFL